MFKGPHYLTIGIQNTRWFFFLSSLRKLKSNIH